MEFIEKFGEETLGRIRRKKRSVKCVVGKLMVLFRRDLVCN
jgi:hypothetical protein